MVIGLLALGIGRGGAAEYGRVAEIFAKHCVDCHAVQDPEGKFVLETHDLLMKGGESGPAIMPGNSSDSLLVKMVEGRFEKDGKTVAMPPGKRKKLETEEIAALRAWIDAGAHGPAAGAETVKAAAIPKIQPKSAPRQPVTAAASTANGQWVALGRHGEIELFAADEQMTVRKITGLKGNVNALAFSPDGQQLYSAAGDPGLGGEAQVWRVADGTLVRTLAGHRDALYALAVSPDGKRLATGGYDQTIKLWNLETGEELRTLTGHNGCIYGLSFRADGKILASSSGDRTVKLWDAATGERRDTFSQPLKEQYAVAFSPDGKRLAAAGADNRIRIWEVTPEAKETTNPLLISKFAHEGSVLRLAYSPDGKWLLSSADNKSVKLWDAETVTEKTVIGTHGDWPTALSFVLGHKGAVVGRLDGSTSLYALPDGGTLPLPKPELARVEPRGVQRGTTARLKLTGKRFHTAKAVKFAHPGIKAELLTDPAPSFSEAWINVEIPGGLPRGAQEFAVTTAAGETPKQRLHIDELPQISPASAEQPVRLSTLPTSIWGTLHKPGDLHRYEFRAPAGQTIVFDAAARGLGSKADLRLTLSDTTGRILASGGRVDGTSDPLLVHTFAAEGEFLLAVQDAVFAGSAEHYYRVDIGSFPYVAGVFPTMTAKDEPAKVRLLGFNLPPDAAVALAKPNGAESVVPVDAERFRFRREFKVAVTDREHRQESEPNNGKDSASSFPLGGIVSGQFAGGTHADEDWFKFNAAAGETWVLETAAAQIGSPADTKLEVLDAAGQPVLRTYLQAVRDSAITFRGIDSSANDCRVENWEEMEMNQLLYLQGEVVKLFRAPQGPDSGWVFYNRNGRRKTYFDTSATAHAVNEPCYIVEARAPDAPPRPNGLPVFPIYFENDDDAERRLGSDSKLFFTASKAGEYFVRVTETRGFTGDRFAYRLSVRRARPDFNATLGGANPAIARGSGQSFTINVERLDGFEGPVDVTLTGLPAGLVAPTQLTVQAGLTSASGTMFVTTNCPSLSEAEASGVKVLVSAEIDGQRVTKEPISFGKIALAESAPLYVTLAAPGTNPAELSIAPGQTVSAKIRIHRQGHAGRVSFNVDNLPHGVIVDNIGLSGVLIPEDQDEREITLMAAKWVPETDRACYAVSSEAGRQTSAPLLLKVRGASRNVASAPAVPASGSAVR